MTTNSRSNGSDQNELRTNRPTTIPPEPTSPMVVPSLQYIRTHFAPIDQQPFHQNQLRQWSFPRSNPTLQNRTNHIVEMRLNLVFIWCY